MARYRGAVCRLCRREGVKLMLKGAKCGTDRCPMERRAYPPGQRSKRVRRKQSGYAIQLREKQKIRRIYGVLERQFRNYFDVASRQKGVTGDALLQLLERRLDNFAFRCGFAPSRNAARQLVRHGHFLVNGHKVNIPSYLLKVGDVVTPREKSKNIEVIKTTLEAKGEREILPWFSIDRTEMTGTLLAIPSREQIPTNVQEQLVVELYSK